MKGYIECMVCGESWDWIDEHSFHSCKCGNLYVIGHKYNNELLEFIKRMFSLPVKFTKEIENKIVELTK